MKKKAEKLFCYVVALVFVVIGCALPGNLVKADEIKENTVKVYYYNENEWEVVNIWSWTMDTNTNLAKNAWPGDAMQDEGNGWFSAEIKVEAEEKIAVLFTDNAGNQTADCKDLLLGNTYWITNGSEEAANDSGMGGGVSLVTATEPQAGWPEGPAADTETMATTTTSEEPTSNHVVVYIVIAVVVVIGFVGVMLRKKNKK